MTTPRPSVLLDDDEPYSRSAMGMAPTGPTFITRFRSPNRSPRRSACGGAILARVFLTDLAATHGKAARGFTPAALEPLEGYDWPGNLVELRGEVNRMLIFAQSPMLGAELISRKNLHAPPSEADADCSAEAVLVADRTPEDRVGLIEMCILRETPTRHRRNKSRAAAKLGLSRMGLRAKLDRYGAADSSGRVPEEVED